MITEPMLAGTIKDLKDIIYPVLCTPKIDGIRCLKVGGKALSRNFKPIANKYIRKTIEQCFPDGVDGELTMKGNFQTVSSAVMTEEGQPDFTYSIFDYVKENLDKTYKERMIDLKNLRCTSKFSLILPITVSNEKELLKFQNKCLSEGYEGIMIRSENSPYKCGRSTIKEGYLLKLKMFNDTEAIIMDTKERMQNKNRKQKDVFGRTKRSSHKRNLLPTRSLGAFIVRSEEFSSTYSVGSGFTGKQRIEFWKKRRSLIGKIIKIKYQSIGILHVPRFPVFIGFRDKRDL